MYAKYFDWFLSCAILLRRPRTSNKPQIPNSKTQTQTNQTQTNRPNRSNQIQTNKPNRTQVIPNEGLPFGDGIVRWIATFGIGSAPRTRSCECFRFLMSEVPLYRGTSLIPRPPKTRNPKPETRSCECPVRYGRTSLWGPPPALSVPGSVIRVRRSKENAPLSLQGYPCLAVNNSDAWLSIHTMLRRLRHRVRP